MLYLLKLLFIGKWHEHEYEQLERLTKTSFLNETSVVYVLKCTKCGNIKQTEIK